MGVYEPSKLFKIAYGVQGWSAIADLNMRRLNTSLLFTTAIGDVHAPSGVNDRDILVWDAANARWQVTPFYSYFQSTTTTVA